MKNSLLSIICVAAAAATLFSCAKESKLALADKAPVKGIKVNVIAGDDLSKTYVEDGEIPVVKWSDGDMVAVLESMDGAFMGLAQSDPAIINAGKASFAASLSWEAVGGSSYKYAAVYPAQAAINYNSEYLLYLPETQYLQGNNFADDADVLFSTVVDNGDSRLADGADVQFAFRRLGTVVRMDLEGIPAGEKIKQITIEAPIYLAGTITYDPATSSVDPETAFGVLGENSIVLYADNLVATGSDVVWFRVLAERDLGEDDDWLYFEVITDKGIYGKEIYPCPTLKFVDGGLTKFGVDLSDCAVEPQAVPYAEDFENGARGWIFNDEDGDGYNWFAVSGLANSGDVSLASASWYYGEVLTPDNWAFTPPVQLTEGNYLSFFVRAANTSYPAEHYAVYIAEGSPYGALDVLMAETEYPLGDYVEVGEDGYYQHYIIQIPAKYDNKAVCIGFRHFNCEDQYYLMLDDVSITEDYPPLVTPPCDAQYEDYLGQWAEGAKIFTIEQKVAGESYYISGLVGQGEYPVEAKFSEGRLVLYEQIVDTDGENEVALQGLYLDGGYLEWYTNYAAFGTSVLLTMSYDDTPSLTIRTSNSYIGYIWTYYENGSYSAYGTYTSSIPATLKPYVPDTTTYIYEEDFEDDVEAEWTFIDSDGDGNNWYQASGKAFSGANILTSASYYNGALTPDNWAFTPPITLTSDNYLSFWICPQDPDWSAEHYAAYIIDEQPTAENLANCTVLLEEQEYPEGNYADITSDGLYQRFVVQIPSSFDGKQVYIGFRHFNCTDMFRLNLDNVAVSEGNPIQNNAAPTFKVKKAAAPRVRDCSFLEKSRPMPSRASISGALKAK